jgi:hypothetical protein
MKRIISTVLVCLLLIGSVFALASCGALSGTYKDITGGVTYDFRGSKVTITVDTYGEDKVYEGTYKVEETEDDKTITFTFEDENVPSIYEGTKKFSEGEEDGVKYIWIGIAKYTKVEK